MVLGVGVILSLFAGVFNSADGDLTVGELLESSVTTIAAAVVRQGVWSKDGVEREIADLSENSDT